MSQVLYRKYRSKNFAEIIGQDHIVSILTESVLNANISHGYLFCGPRGTGKTSIARLLAKAINCENFDKLKDVCNECSYCKIINDGESMDIIEMDAASNRGIEEIRNMRDTVNYMPSSLKLKVYIIDEAHMLTKEAFNALLKTLEEPPEHVVFILATTEPHKLPITILSRVQRYDLSLASEKDLSQKIMTIISQEEREIDKKSVEIIYHKSGGSFRDAESILGKILSSTTKKKISEKDLYETLGIIEDDFIEDFINALQSYDSEKALSLLYKMFEKTGSVNNIIDQSLEKLRERIILNVNSLDRNIYNLANLFIGLKLNLKDFNDKLALAEIEIVNYCNLSAKRIVESQPLDSQPAHISNRSEDQKSSKKSELETAEDSKVTNVTTIGNLKDLISHIVLDSRTKYPRLKSILESSEIKMENDSIVIANKHKFNIIYLQRLEVKNYLLEKASGTLSISNIKFIIAENLVEEETKTESPKLEKQENHSKNKESGVDVPVIKVSQVEAFDQSSQEEIDEVKMEHKDNTLLVENLF